MRSTRALDAYKGRRVLVTGHTGFKGAWLSLWLAELGATVIGISDAVPTDPSLFVSARIGESLQDRRADIRDAAAIRAIIAQERPDLILHLAAQPIVRRSLADPYETLTINVIGTLNVLEAARCVPGVSGVVVITSDKVYRDRAVGPPYSEDDALGGHEPYGASKAAAEIVTEVYTHASFHRGAASLNVPRIVTARAGNVIGGGDWAESRLIPDIVRAIARSENVILRYPRSVRPWQHVLEPLGGYLTLGLSILSGGPLPPCVNFGPHDRTPFPVIDLVSLFLKAWGPSDTQIVVNEDLSGVEAAMLQVNSSLAESMFGWRALWDAPRAVSESASWYRGWAAGDDMARITRSQIATYMREWDARIQIADSAA